VRSTAICLVAAGGLSFVSIASDAQVRVGSGVQTPAVFPSCAEVTILAPGVEHSGALSDSDCLRAGSVRTRADYYRINVANGPLTILLSSQSLDPYLLLYRTDGSLLAEDDDSGVGRSGEDAGIERYMTAGSYIVAVTTLHSRGGGNYSLTVTTRSAGFRGCSRIHRLNAVPGSSAPQPITGSLSRGDCVEYGDSTPIDYYEIPLPGVITTRARVVALPFTSVVCYTREGTELQGVTAGLSLEDTLFECSTPFSAAPGTIVIGVGQFVKAPYGPYSLACYPVTHCLAEPPALQRGH
jgi:hypothetical protein